MDVYFYSAISVSSNSSILSHCNVSIFSIHNVTFLHRAQEEVSANIGRMEGSEEIDLEQEIGKLRQQVETLERERVHWMAELEEENL